MSSPDDPLDFEKTPIAPWVYDQDSDLSHLPPPPTRQIEPDEEVVVSHPDGARAKLVRWLDGSPGLSIARQGWLTLRHVPTGVSHLYQAMPVLRVTEPMALSPDATLNWMIDTTSQAMEEAQVKGDVSQVRKLRTDRLAFLKEAEELARTAPVPAIEDEPTPGALGVLLVGALLGAVGMGGSYILGPWLAALLLLLALGALGRIWDACRTNKGEPPKPESVARPEPINEPPPEPPPGQMVHPLHTLAKDLETGLRLYKLIEKDASIQASRPIKMQVGDSAPNGVSFTVTLPLNCPAAKVVNHLHEIATAFDTTDDKLIMLPAGGSNRLLWVWRCDRHPLGGPGTWSPLQSAEETNVYKGWQFGWTVTGEPVTISPVDDRMLVAGSPGSGKSVSAGLIPLGYALDPHAQMVLMDPEGFGAWAPYEQVAEVIEGSDPDTLRRMAEKLEWFVNTELVRRQKVVQRIRREQPGLLDKDAITETVSRDPRYGVPALLLAIEEVTSLLKAADKDTRELAEWALGELTRRCRKYAITVVLVTQKATADNIPSHITSMMTSQYLGACGTNAMADCVIPDWRDYGMNPRKSLTTDDGRGGGTPGGGYLHGRALVEPVRSWVLMRTDYVTSANVRAIMDRAYRSRLEQRPDLLPQKPAIESTEEPLAYPEQVSEKLDLTPLRDIANVLESNGDMAAPQIIEELIYEKPHLYGEVPRTRAGLDELLQPFEMVTRQVRVSGHRPYGLRYSWVASRLNELGDGCREVAPDVDLDLEPKANGSRSEDPSKPQVSDGFGDVDPMDPANEDPTE